MGVLSREALDAVGFAGVGANVLVSDRASFHGPGRITIGNNVRIDDFCVLSAGAGGIEIGSHIHIAVFSMLMGAGKITLSDFCNVSSRVSIYSSTDDFSGHTMSNPMIPARFKAVLDADVFLGKHVIIGSGSVVLPGVTLEEGVAIGALSLVRKSCAAFGVYAGNPARRLKDRQRTLLELEKIFLASQPP